MDVEARRLRAPTPMNATTEFRDITRTVKRLLVVNGLFLAVMTLFRLVFFLAFSETGQFRGMYRYVAEAFFLGVRFDLSVVAYVNTLVTLTLLIVGAAGRRRWLDGWSRIIPPYYGVMYGIVFFLLLVDFGYFSYFKDHLNVTVFGFFEDDTLALVKTIVQDGRFPLAFAALLAMPVGIFFLSRRVMTKPVEEDPGAGKPSRWLTAGFAAGLVLANGLAARGTLQMFPLAPFYAEISPDPFINKLSVNGVFALSEALGARAENGSGELNVARRMGYGEDERLVFADLRGVPVERLTPDEAVVLPERRTPVNAAAERLRPNVVLVVSESFGANLLRYDAPGFDLLGEFREHFRSDYVFENFLPAGLITIHAVESIVLNIYQRPFNLSVTQTKHAYQPFPSAATRPYKEAGYRTLFIYGGSLRWRQLDSFLPRQGFDELVGEGHFPRAEKNQWGVYDEYLFDEAFRKLSEGPAEGGAPKLIMILTTTNHPPYSVPSSYVPGPLRIPDKLRAVMTNDETLALKRCVTYRYANQKLGEFISRVKASPLGGRTIVAVTGDHNFWDIFSYGDADRFLRYSVPFYLYVPQALRPARTDTGVAGCHADIMPTLYRLSLSKAAYRAMGSDLFDAKAPHAAINGEGLLATKSGLVVFGNESGKASYYRFDPAARGKLVAAGEAGDLVRGAAWYRAAMSAAEFVIRDASARPVAHDDFR